MFPVLFSLGPITIHSYGFFVALGYILCVFVASSLSKSKGIEALHANTICLIALIFGLLGARTLFVATQWNFYKENPENIPRLWQGGMVFYGGFIAGFFSVLISARLFKIKILPLLDILSIGLTIAHSVGRIGCFAVGCCHGKQCDLPWGTMLDTDLVDPTLRGVPIHPVQIYEAIALASLALILWRIWKNNREGLTLWSYLLGYTTIRFFVEDFRGDSIRGTWPQINLSTSQGISIIIFLINLGFGIYLYQKSRQNEGR